ncbi:MAG: 2-dehydropantoate 2-reductase N-terminal domain-containing protein [Blautia sp.]|nr:hypothetical protein [Blautia sp.]MDY3998158.1 2-dehydropantoate 2-reductase N-terminal domain-containing protein [Blautia sp.]
MSETIIIGAGKTGRGFVARLLAEKNIPVTFVDKDEILVNQLKDAAKKDGFTVRFFGEKRTPMKLTDYEAVTWEKADFTDAELIFVSVGGTNLADVGAELRGKLPSDHKVHIITCENASDPAGILKKAIDRDNVAVSQATVFCTTTAEKGELDIASENYPYLQFDADLLEGYVPKADTIRPVKNFGNFLTRKLFTYNAASAVIAYLGYIYGFTDYSQAANSPVIQELLDQNYAVTNKVLCEEFGYDPEDQKEFARLSRDKFTSRTIVDTVERNAREPQRKLGPKERIIGPLQLIYNHGENCQVLAMTAAAALLYDGEGEDVWREIRRTRTPEEILKEIGGVKEQPLIDLVMEQYHKFAKAKNPLAGE